MSILRTGVRGETGVRTRPRGTRGERWSYSLAPAFSTVSFSRMRADLPERSRR